MDEKRQHKPYILQIAKEVGTLLRADLIGDQEAVKSQLTAIINSCENLQKVIASEEYGKEI